VLNCSVSSFVPRTENETYQSYARDESIPHPLPVTFLILRRHLQIVGSSRNVNRPSVQPAGIDVVDRIVANVPIEITWVTIEANRILAHPPAGGRVEPAGAVVVQARRGLVEDAREAEQVLDLGAALAHQVAKAVVNPVAGHRGFASRRIVLGQVPRCPQVVGQGPENIARAGQRLDGIIVIRSCLRRSQ